MIMRKLVDRGIDWVGAVPENWKFKKGKYLFQQRSERGNTIELQLLSPTQKFGCIPQSLYEELTGANAVKLNEKTDLNLLKTIHRGDFCISLRSFQGGFEYSDYEGVVSPAYQVFYPTRNDVYRGYYKYMFKDGAFIDKMNSFTLSLRDGKNIAFADFGNTLLPRPSFEEQRTIADYLDKKTSEIDAAIKEAQELIEKYKAYKQSIITEIVTKGLNPNVTMKDSGVEWIGEIPEHWGCHPVYVYFDERKNLNYRMQEQNLLSLSYGKIIRKDINTNGGLLPVSFTTYNIVEDGDIIIRPTDLQNDKKSLRTGLVKERGIITSAYIALKSKFSQSSRYYHYMLHTADVCKVFYNMGNGVRQGLNYSEFSKLMMISPSVSEQEAIADYLDDKCAKIDSIIADKETLISRLQEYKKSIIFEYVTGKKEVPNG